MKLVLRYSIAMRGGRRGGITFIEGDNRRRFSIAVRPSEEIEPHKFCVVSNSAMRLVGELEDVGLTHRLSEATLLLLRGLIAISKRKGDLELVLYVHPDDLKNGCYLEIIPR
jgi:hypothetical protein